MFRYFSIFTSRFSLSSLFLLLTSTRIFSMFAKKLTQESKKMPCCNTFQVFSVVSAGWTSRFKLQSYRYQSVPRRLISWPDGWE